MLAFGIMLEFKKNEPDGVLKIHSLFFNNSILSNYYEPDRVLGVGDTVRNKVDNVCALRLSWNLLSWCKRAWGRNIDNEKNK